MITAPVIALDTRPTEFSAHTLTMLGLPANKGLHIYYRLSISNLKMVNQQIFFFEYYFKQIIGIIYYFETSFK